MIQNERYEDLGERYEDLGERYEDLGERYEDLGIEKSQKVQKFLYKFLTFEYEKGRRILANILANI